jgi:predicted Zn-dependent protease
MILIASLASILGCPPSVPSAPKATKSEAEQLARDGLALLARGDSAAADAAFVNARAAARNEPWGRLGMAAKALAAGDLEGARKLLDALRADGLDPAAAAPYLTAVIDTIKVAPAVASATPKAAGDPGAAPGKPGHVARDQELVELFRAGHYNGVVQRVAPDPEPNLFRLKLLGDAYYNLQRWQEAVVVYRKVLSKDPGDEAVTQYLADGLFRLERFDDSIRMYRVLADAHPEQAGFWKQIGDVAIAKGDDEVALAAYNRAVEGGFDKPEVKAQVERLRKKLAEGE